MANGPFDQETGELIPRDPSLEDVVALCRQLADRGARFIVVRGFAMRVGGYPRHTGDVDQENIENEILSFITTRSSVSGLNSGPPASPQSLRSRDARKCDTGFPACV